MRSFKEIKNHYAFTPDDESTVASLAEMMADHQEAVMDVLRAWILGTKEAVVFFRDEARRQKVFDGHERWFHDLFAGKYDSRYYEQLIRIGQAHVKADVEPHFMNRAMNIVRGACTDVITRRFEHSDERVKALISLDKLLDINLDIITSSYIEEELRTFSSAFRVRNALVTFSERFTQSMNFVLVIALMGLTIGVVGLFIYDIWKLVTGDLNHAIITSLGSLLVLWIMIELMNTEISHLKGGRFRISVFVGVALVAIIRDTMIISLKHEDMEKLVYFISLILILGIVFWLVTRAEERVK
ncbi:MAG: phosphate-starvation-inducible PsiE family protein [Chloroflexota bacterium]